MRAVVTRLSGVPEKPREKVLVDDWPEPDSQLTGADVLIRTRFTGITNGTERNDILGGVYAWRDDELPAGTGYQNVGEVIAVGPEVSDLEPGAIVFSHSDHVELARFDSRNELVRLPPEMDPRHAALFGMASVALRTVDRAQPEVGQRVLVVGGGVIGQVTAQLVALRGAHVTLGELHERRLEMARRIGAVDATVNTARWAEAIEESSFDHVIDLAGRAGMEDDLVSAVVPGGVLTLMAGRFRFDYPFLPGQIRSITIRQDTGFHRGDLHAMTRLVSKGFVQIAPLIQDVVPVAEADRIYGLLRDSPTELFGTVFDWGVE